MKLLLDMYKGAAKDLRDKVEVRWLFIRAGPVGIVLNLILD